MRNVKGWCTDRLRSRVKARLAPRVGANLPFAKLVHRPGDGGAGRLKVLLWRERRCERLAHGGIPASGHCPRRASERFSRMRSRHVSHPDERPVIGGDGEDHERAAAGGQAGF